jgi:eukaryotic-like serine/threonine-protein kinase
LVGQEGHELFLWAEAPEHGVEITKPFYLGTTEVTVGQFRQFIEVDPKYVVDERWQNPGFDQKDDHPAAWISWQNAVDFCNWLSEREGESTARPRRPSESTAAGRSGARYCYGADEAQ